MNKTRFFMTLTLALLLAATWSFAHDGEKHVVKLKIDSDSEAVEIEDMEVGETRQFFTDSGKEVVVTRGEEGYDLTVDGKKIDITSPGGVHAAHVVKLKGEEGEAVKVFVKKMVEGHGGEHTVVVSGDCEEHECPEGHHAIFISEEGEVHEIGDHHAVVWTGEGEEGEGHHTISVTVDAKSVADQVLESGVLDQLDEATRQKILDEIKKAEGPRRIRAHAKAIVIDSEEDE